MFLPRRVIVYTSYMETQRLQVWFFLALLGGVGLLTIIIFLPYLTPIILAGTFAVLFQPLHQWVRAHLHGYEKLAALTTLLVILVAVLVPLWFIGLQTFEEAQRFYQSGGSGNNSIVDRASDYINTIVGRIAPGANLDIPQLSREAAAWLIGHSAAFFSGFVTVILYFFLTIISLYYFLKDGSKFTQVIAHWSPLPTRYNEEILEKLEVAINSVIRGTLLIAIIQGIITGIGFSIFKIPNPILFGSTAIFAALIPGIGTALVLLPAIFYLFLTGDIANGVGLTIWGMLGVGLIDNILGPIIIERGINIHPLLILFSVLGGLSFFGPIGFIMGPLVLSLLFALLKIYLEFIKKES